MFLVHEDQVEDVAVIQLMLVMFFKRYRCGVADPPARHGDSREDIGTATVVSESANSRPYHIKRMLIVFSTKKHSL